MPTRKPSPLDNESVEYTYLEDAEDIFARDEPVERIVRVPEWRKEHEAEDPRVLVRGMYADARRAFEERGLNSNANPGDEDYLNNDWWTKHRRYELVALSVVRRDGRPVFTMKQVEKLAQMQAKPIERLYQAAQEVNGYDRDELRRSGKVDGSEMIGSSHIALQSPSENGTSEGSL